MNIHALKSRTVRHSSEKFLLIIGNRHWNLGFQIHDWGIRFLLIWWHICIDFLPRLCLNYVSDSYLSKFDKEYIYSHTDAIAFMGKMQHGTEYEILDLVKNKWIKQRYTLIFDNNEQEQTKKMIHNFRMGWCRLSNYR